MGKVAAGICAESNSKINGIREHNAFFCNSPTSVTVMRTRPSSQENWRRTCCPAYTLRQQCYEIFLLVGKPAASRNGRAMLFATGRCFSLDSFSSCTHLLVSDDDNIVRRVGLFSRGLLTREEGREER